MGVRLTVDESAWRDHVTTAAAALPGLIPVVKGNGYGFGRDRLVHLAVDLLDPAVLAVGTVWEAASVPRDRTPLVLTPTATTLPVDLHARAVLTVGSASHVQTLVDQGWRGDVVVKLVSSMRRYGTDDPGSLVAQCQRAGLRVVAAAAHPPLAGTDDDHVAEVSAALTALEGVVPHDVPLDVSHVSPAAFAAIDTDRPLRMRAGTSLWHGDKSALHLDTDVVDVRAVRSGQPVGYRATPCPSDGHLVLIGAGSAHGVVPLDDGRSPFHWARTRLALVEPPHMHTSIAIAPTGAPCPAPGDRVDVQRPLITTSVDEVVWR